MSGSATVHYTLQCDLIVYKNWLMLVEDIASQSGVVFETEKT